jgi:hypothetical protein
MDEILLRFKTFGLIDITPSEHNKYNRQYLLEFNIFMDELKFAYKGDHIIDTSLIQ